MTPAAGEVLHRAVSNDFSTGASIRSVVHASGAALDLVRVADQYLPSRQLQLVRTNRAPFIDSIAAWTG